MPYDVFISYRSLDNGPRADGSRWVSVFYVELARRLTEVLGRKVEVFFDSQLDQSQPLSDIIRTKIAESSALVCVISPAYLSPDAAWCHAERDHFLARFPQAPPVFKVVKLVSANEVRDRDSQPEPLRQCPGYRFHRKGQADKYALELEPDDAEYAEALNDLAYEIANRLQPREVRAERVYLAEVSSDLEDARLGLKRQLVELGYPVMPEGRLPLIFEQVERFVSEELGRSRVSVHMLGAPWGIIAERTPAAPGMPPDRQHGESLVAQQLRLAHDLPNGVACAPILWLPQGIDQRDARSDALIAELKADPARLELLEGDLESLKQRVLERLKQAPPPPPKPASARKGVYLLYDTNDEAAADRLQLTARAVDIYPPPPVDADEETRRSLHTELLRESEVVLAYWGAASRQWVYATIADIHKAMGLGRSAPFEARAVFLGDPQTPLKRQFNFPNWRVLRTHAELDAFLGEIAG